MLLIGVIAFIGFALAPLLSSVMQARQVSRPTPTATEAATANTQEDLKAQEKGYELVLQREPDNEAALRGLLEVRLQLNNIAGTLEPLTKLAELKPNETRYTILLAQVKQYTNDLEGSAQIYRQILEKEPGNTQALQGLVELLIQQERPEAAIGLLEETLQIAPKANETKTGSVDVVAVNLLLGQVYGEQGNLEKAIAIYDKVQKENPADFRPLVGKGLVLQRQGKLEESKAMLSTAEGLAPPQYKDRIKALITQLETANETKSSPQNADQGETPAPAETPIDDAPIDETSEAETTPEGEAGDAIDLGLPEGENPGAN